MSAAGEAQSERAAASVAANTDSFGNWITPNEQPLIDQPGQAVPSRNSIAVPGVGNMDASAPSGISPPQLHMATPQEFSAAVESNPTEDVRVTAGEPPAKDSFGHAMGPDEQAQLGSRLIKSTKR